SELPGQWWLAYVPEGAPRGRVPKIRVSTEIERAGGPGSFSFWFDGKHGNYWDYTTPGSGAVLYEELALGALKGMTNSPRDYFFLPFADGSFQAELRTGNDFQVMEAGL